MKFQSKSILATLTISLCGLSAQAFSQEVAAKSCLKATKTALYLETKDANVTFDTTACAGRLEVLSSLKTEIAGIVDGDLESFDFNSTSIEDALGTLVSDFSRTDGSIDYSEADIEDTAAFYEAEAAPEVLNSTITSNVFGGTGITEVFVFFTKDDDKIVVLTKRTYAE